MVTRSMTGEDRCWPCTVANAIVGLVVAWLPLAVELLQDEPRALLLAVGWGIAVSTFTIYRLLARGYLPMAEPVAKATGLARRIGPEADARSEASTSSDDHPRSDADEEE